MVVVLRMVEEEEAVVGVKQDEVETVTIEIIIAINSKMNIGINMLVTI